MATPLKTTQEYLNAKAGFTGTLRTEQECLMALTSRTAGTRQDLWNAYAGTTGLDAQIAANFKATGVQSTRLTIQQCAALL